MFGQARPTPSPHDTPQWMVDLVAQHKRGVDLQWWPSDISYGCCWLNREIIELRCPADECPASKRLVLHELGHVLCPTKSALFGRRGKPSYHGVAFCATVARLYDQHGIYDSAIDGDEDERESYVTVRRYLAAHRTASRPLMAG